MSEKLSIEKFAGSKVDSLVETRGGEKYLEELVLTTEQFGEEYVALFVEGMNLGESESEDLIQIIVNREFSTVKDLDSRNQAFEIAREAEEVKRILLTDEISKNHEAFSKIELALLLGGLELARLTDKIYSDEWLPLVVDSSVGQALAKLEEEEPGTAADKLPGKPEEIRWFTRDFVDESLGLTEGNIKLVPYRESLETVPELIVALEDMANAIEEEKNTGENDFGYVEFLRAWVDCFKGEGNQKELEDQMMIAWRKIDPDTPVFMVPWAENDYFDPAGITMMPSFRIGVKSSSEQAQRLEVAGAELKETIIDFVESGVPGADVIKESDTYYRIWTGKAGFDLFFPIASQVLPNDETIRATMGATILPDVIQIEKAEGTRDKLARRGWPKEIEEALRPLKMSAEEAATSEVEAHELGHPVGVIMEGRIGLGKLSNLFEEPKATEVGMVAQVKKKADLEFSLKLIATLLHAAPRFLALDESQPHQGYANGGRIALNIAEKTGILSVENDGSMQLDISNSDKIEHFWREMEQFVNWCYSAYGLAADPDSYPGGLEKIREEVNAGLDIWRGVEQGEDVALIKIIKENLEKNK